MNTTPTCKCGSHYHTDEEHDGCVEANRQEAEDGMAEWANFRAAHGARW